MISYNMCFPALTTFYSGKLFCLTMKLLNFPAYAAHLPYSICVVLSHVVRNNIVRAPGRQHNPEQSHFVISRKILYFYNPAMPEFFIVPFRGIRTSVRSDIARIISITVISERTIIQFPRFPDEQHLFLCRIPCIRRHGTKILFSVIYAVCQHIPYMLRLCLTVSVRVGDTEVGYPKLILIGIHIYTSYNSDSSDNAVCITTVLSPNSSDFTREIFIRNRIIEDDISVGSLYHLLSDILPHRMGLDFITGQITIDRIMSEPFAVVGKVCQSMIYLTAKQILAIIQSAYFIFFAFSHRSDVTKIHIHCKQKTVFCVSPATDSISKIRLDDFKYISQII